MQDIATIGKNNSDNTPLQQTKGHESLFAITIAIVFYCDNVTVKNFLHIEKVNPLLGLDFSEPEQLTRCKSKRLIEGFVCHPLLSTVALHPVIEVIKRFLIANVRGVSNDFTCGGWNSNTICGLQPVLECSIWMDDQVCSGVRMIRREWKAFIPADFIVPNCNQAPEVQCVLRKHTGETRARPRTHMHNSLAAMIVNPESRFGTLCSRLSKDAKSIYDLWPIVPEPGVHIGASEGTKFDVCSAWPFSFDPSSLYLVFWEEKA
jgi:hypothetical protein